MLLEIGIQNGGSLQIWEKYFPAAVRLVGCDINPNCERLSYGSDKIELVVGDINQPETLARIFSIASRFDIVIDDGSHTSSDIIQAFCNLFPHLKQGGLFIAEDLHCSYWENYQGGLHHPRSSMAFFKALADILNVEHWGVAYSREELLQPFGITAALGEAVLAEIHSVEFVNSMCIVTKRPAEENRLGKRHIAGQEARVFPIRHLQGSESSAPSQEGNRFSRSEPSAHCQPVADTASRLALEARLYWHEKRVENVLDYCESCSAAVVYPVDGLPQELASPFRTPWFRRAVFVWISPMPRLPSFCMICGWSAWMGMSFGAGRGMRMPSPTWPAWPFSVKAKTPPIPSSPWTAIRASTSPCRKRCWPPSARVAPCAWRSRRSRSPASYRGFSPIPLRPRGPLWL